MKQTMYLIKRNCAIFFRDKSTVFFSMLSMFITLGLMVIFLGKMNSDNLVQVLAEFGPRDTATDRVNASYLIQLWTLAGILATNSVTVPLTVLGAMVQDETHKRLMAFYVTPVNRLKLSLGYILSAFFIGTVLCVLTLLFGELYFMSQGYSLLGAPAIVELIGMIALNTLCFSSLGYLLALFVHSDSAWSGLLTIIGTLVGFVSGTYLTLGSLGKTLQNILKCLPFLHGASMMRKICTASAITKTFDGLPEIGTEFFSEQMGIRLFHENEEFTTGMQVSILLAYAIMAIVLAAILNRNRKLKDR